MFRYRLLHVDATSQARLGIMATAHGQVATPAFMPVGTQGTVKGVEVDQLRATGAEILLSNTYHLAIRPGAEVVASLGGLHAFTGWEGPILTDSGGFQIFSLASQVRIDESQAVFRSHVDGRELRLSPEDAVQIQQALGSDIGMVLDHVVPLPADRESVRQAMHRTIRWAERCRRAHTHRDQALFAIVQGGLEADLRIECAETLVSMDFSGYAVGGLSVGERDVDMYRMLEVTCPALPDDKPRYLMGVGRPVDLLAAIGRGIDLFDCVMPTRNGRNALAFTDTGTLRLRNERYQKDDRPLEPDCPCPACRRSRGYLRHLFVAGEMLGPILLSIHNLTYYQRLVARARDAIHRDGFAEFEANRRAGWGLSREG